MEDVAVFPGIEVNGVQGHVAYPNLADNPIVNLLLCWLQLMVFLLMMGMNILIHQLLVTTIVPTIQQVMLSQIKFRRFNIRFNTEHQADHLIIWLKEHFDKVSNSWQADWHISAPSIFDSSGQLTDLMKDSIFEVTGISLNYPLAGVHQMQFYYQCVPSS